MARKQGNQAHYKRTRKPQASRTNELNPSYTRIQVIQVALYAIGADAIRLQENKYHDIGLQSGSFPLIQVARHAAMYTYTQRTQSDMQAIRNARSVGIYANGLRIGIRKRGTIRNRLHGYTQFLVGSLRIGIRNCMPMRNGEYPYTQ